MVKTYLRRMQPAVPALQWDGTQERLEEIQGQAAGNSHQIITWQWEDDEHSLGMSIFTETGDQQVSHGDWILFTEDGPYVSKQKVFEKWYEEV
jgi:hypothetical protein